MTAAGGVRGWSVAAADHDRLTGGPSGARWDLPGTCSRDRSCCTWGWAAAKIQIDTHRERERKRRATGGAPPGNRSRPEP